MQTMFDVQLVCESSIIVATCPRQLDLRLSNLHVSHIFVARPWSSRQDLSKP